VNLLWIASLGLLLVCCISTLLMRKHDDAPRGKATNKSTTRRSIG
jgi:hypothetical protein